MLSNCFFAGGGRVRRGVKVSILKNHIQMSPKLEKFNPVGDETTPGISRAVTSTPLIKECHCLFLIYSETTKVIQICISPLFVCSSDRTSEDLNHKKSPERVSPSGIIFSLSHGGKTPKHKTKDR